MVKNTKGKRKGNLKRKNKDSKPLLDKHHIYPVSRGGEKNKRNIAYILVERHRAFHFLFGNSTPEEIAEVISKEFLGGRYKIIIKEEKFI